MMQQAAATAYLDAVTKTCFLAEPSTTLSAAISDMIVHMVTSVTIACTAAPDTTLSSVVPARIPSVRERVWTPLLMSRSADLPPVAVVTSSTTSEAPKALIGRIDLPTIDASPFNAVNNAFSWRWIHPLNDIGQVRVANVGAGTLVQVNTDFDAAAETEILVDDGAATAFTWSANDFVL